MPLTEKEFYQIEAAIKCMDVVNIVGRGYLISQQNVLVLISKFALLGKGKCPDEGDPEEEDHTKDLRPGELCSGMGP
jgi:hypothetical protein